MEKAVNLNESLQYVENQSKRSNNIVKCLLSFIRIFVEDRFDRFKNLECAYFVDCVYFCVLTIPLDGTVLCISSLFDI